VTDHQLDTAPGAAHPDAPASALDAWLHDLAVELGVGPDVLDMSAVLDVAAAAAGCVGRPAGSLTTFLVGYAAAQGPVEGRPAALKGALERATVLAEQWQDRAARLDGRA